MSYTAVERECLIISDDETDTWSICTLRSKVITKLKKANIHPHKVDSDGTHHYKDIDFNRVSFRNESAKREMTEEQRKAAAERLRKARKIKNGL